MNDLDPRPAECEKCNGYGLIPNGVAVVSIECPECLGTGGGVGAFMREAIRLENRADELAGYHDTEGEVQARRRAAVLREKAEALR